MTDATYTDPLRRIRMAWVLVQFEAMGATSYERLIEWRRMKLDTSYLDSQLNLLDYGERE